MRALIQVLVKCFAKAKQAVYSRSATIALPRKGCQLAATFAAVFGSSKSALEIMRCVGNLDSSMRAWRKITEELGAEIGQEAVLLWLLPLVVRSTPPMLTLYASNSLVESEVQAFLPRIRQAVQKHAPEHLDVMIKVGDGIEVQVKGFDPSPVQTRSALPADYNSRVDPRYTFDNFVEGRSNQLAKYTTLQMLREPGSASYNPLMLYGGTGLGKTHLLHAVGNAIQAQAPYARVLYVRSEDFVSGMMKALRGEGNSSTAMDQFKQLYRNLDCLLIDDIQFFAGKERSQEEFFHTFNTLYDSRQQIVMTCDRFPKELERFEQRLQSRFGWGLSVAVEPPDFETRVEILLAKSERAGQPLDEPVAQLIAKRMRSNVRELEGALNTLTARAHFSGRSVTMEFAQETLRDLFAVQDRSVSVSSIQKAVAEYARVSLSDLLSAKRTRSIARARQLAMALTKELTQLSLKEIGEAYGGRDHTTVLHACRLMVDLKKTEGQAVDDWQNMMRKLVG
jgi:chromosomal replication initiator protein